LFIKRKYENFWYGLEEKIKILVKLLHKPGLDLNSPRRGQIQLGQNLWLTDLFEAIFMKRTPLFGVRAAELLVEKPENEFDCCRLYFRSRQRFGNCVPTTCAFSYKSRSIYLLVCVKHNKIDIGKTHSFCVPLEIPRRAVGCQPLLYLNYRW